MKIADAITMINTLKSHQHGEATLVGWLSDLDRQIWEEIIKTHENTAVVEAYDDAGNLITDMPKPGPYVVDEVEKKYLQIELLVPDPYSKIYPYYLSAQIDNWNGDIARYNNSMVMYNTAYSEFADWYNRNYMPKQDNHISV